MFQGLIKQMARITIIITLFIVFTGCSLSDKMNAVVRTPDNRYFKSESILLSGPNNVNHFGVPDWSPDSQSIVFSAGGDIWKKSIDQNNSTLLVSDGADNKNPRWSASGNKIVFEGNGIWMMDDNGDNLVNITNEGADPIISPDETKIAFADCGTKCISTIEVQNKITSVVQPFQSVTWLYRMIDYSLDGNLILYQRSTIGGDSLFKYNVEENNNTFLAHNSYDNSFSPDESKILYWTLTFNPETGSNFASIATVNVNSLNEIVLAAGPYDNVDPDWSPDGNKIAFVSDRSGNYDVLIMNPDGSEQEVVAGTSEIETTPKWSPDGSMLLYFVGGEVRLLRR